MTWASTIVLLGIGVAISVTALSASAEPLTPEAFRERVLAAGGDVGFVFEELPTPSCHASTLAEMPNGDLLCAWFGGTHENNPDVAIWLARYSEAQWSEPELVAKVEESAHWNPVLFVSPDGDVHLYFKVGPQIPSWRTYWMKSEDGHEWTEPAPLVPGDEGGRGPVRCKPIVLSDGTWLAGASTEYDGWRPFVDRSTDGGETWERTDYWELDEAITGPGAIQPTLWESEPGHVHALLRTTAGRIGRADSTDGGRTWSTVYLIDLPNPSAGIDVVRLDNGALLLIYNPVSEGRSPITLARSEDNGDTWQDIAHLETIEGEFSYPAIIRTDDGVAISYTWQRLRIKAWTIPMGVLGNPNRDE